MPQRRPARCRSTRCWCFPRVTAPAVELVDRARRAAELAGTPAVVYQRAAVRLGADDLEPAVSDGAVIGLKDGTRDLRSLRRLMDAFGTQLTFAAAFEDMTLAYWALGVDALCPASTAHDPAYSRRWLRSLRAGDLAGARAQLQAFGYPFTDLRFSRPGIDVAVVKHAMHLRDVPAGGVRAPGVPLTSEEKHLVAFLLDRLDSPAVKW